MQDLSASFRSTVLKNDDYVFEIVTIQAYSSSNKDEYACNVMVREAEIQCFNVDERGHTFLEPDDWLLRFTDCSPTNSKKATKLVNTIIADLVQDHNVRDVQASSEMVKAFRKTYHHQFAGVSVLSNVTHAKNNLDGFWCAVRSLLGQGNKEDFNAVKGIFTRKLPMMNPERFREKQEPSTPVRQYELWGVFS